MTTGSMGEILNLLLGGGSSLPPGIPQGATRVSDTLYIVTLSDGRTAYFVPEYDLADEPTGRFVLDTSYVAPSGGGGGAAAPSVSSYMDVVTTDTGVAIIDLRNPTAPPVQHDLGGPAKPVILGKGERYYVPQPDGTLKLVAGDEEGEFDIVTTTQGLFRVNKQTGGVEQIYEFGMSE